MGVERGVRDLEADFGEGLGLSGEDILSVECVDGKPEIGLDGGETRNGLTMECKYYVYVHRRTRPARLSRQCSQARIECAELGETADPYLFEQCSIHIRIGAERS